jgi:hypothetical protein
VVEKAINSIERNHGIAISSAWISRVFILNFFLCVAEPWYRNSPFSDHSRNEEANMTRNQPHTLGRSFVEHAV